ncbi:MAG: hypothetical protein NTZ44_04240 [Candidatus Nomurabacteria bacterium]|nr:hypothetical protein [Candidatus Nomurabacteria bacterium]
MLKDYLNKENLHHAHLIEGNKVEILSELFSFLKEINVEISGNPDFHNLSYDVFKKLDADQLKRNFSEKVFSIDKKAKKVFVISANNFLHEAQNSLLKIFEEPNPNTHFFLIAPDLSVFLPTVLSRFYVISTKGEMIDELKEADKFIKMNLSARLEYIKDLVKGKDDEEESEDVEVVVESPRAKALKFLSALEKTLSKSDLKNKVQVVDQIFKVREYLRQPGSSTKILMESVAIVL